MADKVTVLFLCTHNAARSQMAEGLLRNKAGDRFEALSAGLEPTEIHPEAIQVMEKIGIDISGQKSKSLMEYHLHKHIGYLITGCAKAEEKCPIMPYVGYRIFWPVDDPAAFEGPQQERLNKFRAARDEPSQRIDAWLAELDG